MCSLTKVSVLGRLLHTASAFTSVFTSAFTSVFASVFTSVFTSVFKSQCPRTFTTHRLRLIKATHCNVPLPRIIQSDEYVSLFVPENYQKWTFRVPMGWALNTKRDQHVTNGGLYQPYVPVNDTSLLQRYQKSRYQKSVSCYAVSENESLYCVYIVNV